MRLTIIGSGDAFGSGGRFNTCFHLATGERTVLIDCGASTSVALRAHDVDPATIDAIILSHLHGDHFGGIPLFLIDAQYMTRRERPLVIAGPPGIARAHQCGARGVLSRLARGRVAVFLERDRDSGRRSDRRARPERDQRRSRCTSPAHRRPRCGSPTEARPSRIRATRNGPTRCCRSREGADLFICECFDYDRELTGHLNWTTLRGRHRRLRRTARHADAYESRACSRGSTRSRQSGVLIAEDGLVARPVNAG